MTPQIGEGLGDWLSHNAWSVWFSLAVILAVVEILSLDLIFLMLAMGAVAGGVTALAAPGMVWLQVLVGVVVAVLTLALLRPTLLRRVRNLPGYRGSFSNMVGKPGRATAEITADGGEVKIDGQTWSARSFDSSMTIAAGTPVEVYEIDQTVAVVYPVDQHPLDADPLRELE